MAESTPAPLVRLDGLRDAVEFDRDLSAEAEAAKGYFDAADWRPGQSEGWQLGA